MYLSSDSALRRSSLAGAFWDSTFAIFANSWLEIAATFLFALDRFEQRLEVSFAEAFCSFALNNFEEQCWTVFHGFGEDLQQVAVRFAVHEDAQFVQLFDVFIDFADTLRQCIVIR